jgi:hypothetical protein
MPRPGVARGAWLVAGLLLPVGCRDATQIRLEIRTNVLCTEPDAGWRGVAVYAGPPGAEEQGDVPVLVSRDCDEHGYIGSLVVVPSGDKDGAVGIRVVAALSKEEDFDPADCSARNYRGCIVARRAVRYVPHSSLLLKIDLANTCLNQGCDPRYSCSSGSCLALKDNSQAPASGLHTVHCGDNNAVCNVGDAKRDVCCLRLAADGATSFGACMPSQDCPVDGVVLNCDDESDCDSWDDADGQGECVLSPGGGKDVFRPREISSSQCMHHNEVFSQFNVALALCQDRQACNDNQFACTSSAGNPVNRLPGYYWCEMRNEQ